MKNSPLTMALLAALVVSVLASVVLCYLCVDRSRQVHNLQIQAMDESAQLQKQSMVLGALGNDLTEYSKTHPDIKAILEPAMAKPVTPTAVKPGTK
jgi:hypothetical protein